MGGFLTQIKYAEITVKKFAVDRSFPYAAPTEWSKLYVRAVQKKNSSQKEAIASEARVKELKSMSI